MTERTENLPGKEKTTRPNLLLSASKLPAVVAAVGLAGLGTAAAAPAANEAPAAERPTVEEALQLAKLERAQPRLRAQPRQELKIRQLPLRQIRSPRNVRLRGNLRKTASPAALKTINRIAAEVGKLPDGGIVSAFSLHVQWDKPANGRVQRNLIVR